MFSSKRLLSLSVLSTFLTLASALPIEPLTCSTTRVVQPGDTCEAIANAAGIPVSTLLVNNPAINSGCTNLFIGQVLCTANQATQPPSTATATATPTPAPPACSTTRVVQPGDTCEAIANAAGIPVSTLLANNPAINSGCTNLFIGQVLCTAGQTTQPPATATATPTPAPPTCSTTRVVQPGDTCEAIANAAGISVSTLLANNPAINSGCTNLFIGQVLCTAIQTTPTRRDSTGTCSTTRVVQSGDTCEAIANAVGISVSTLLANNLAINSGCTNLFIGQVLCISKQVAPPPPPPAACSTTRVVQAGDTCEAIANAAGIPVSTLLANNPAINSGCTNLSIGQVLCISNQVAPPPPPPPAAICSITQVVKAGDTCETIANAASIAVLTLLANNPAINSGCTNLSIGQVLCTDFRILSA